MYKHLSISLLLASCTLLPGCGACTGEKEVKSTISTDATDAGFAAKETAAMGTPKTTDAADNMAAEENDVEVKELASATTNALPGGKVHDYKDLINRSGDLKSIISTNDKVVVDFFAVWCGPCKALAPQLDKLAQSNQDVVFIKVDVDKFGSVSGNYGVRAMPTTVYFSKGKEIDRVTGADISKVKAAIDKVKRS